jgi:hypothetical protein
MKRMMRRAVVLLLAIFLIAGLGGCASSGIQISAATRERLDELVQEFVNELEVFILPAKEDNVKLAEQGLTVSKPDATYNIEAVKTFYSEYSDDKNTRVTFAFSSSSFVVTRVIIEGKFGYYLRYQDGSAVGGELPITGKLVDSVALTEDTDLNKVELTLRREKADVATFTFKHMKELPAPEVV